MITGLLLVVARLVHLHLPDTLACLAAQPAPHGVHILAWLSGIALDCRRVARPDSLSRHQDMVLVLRSTRHSVSKQLSAMLPAQLWLR